TPSSSNNIVNVSTIYYLDSGLIDDTTYYYRIKAYDEVPNMGTASDESSGTPHDSVAPGKVTGLSVQNLQIGNKLKLTWTASTALDIELYYIYRSTTSGFVVGPGTFVTSTNETTYNDSGLSNGITYYYRVSAVDEVPNEGNPSDEKAGIPTDETPPAKVQNLKVNNPKTGNLLQLTWEASSATDLDRYNIYRSTTPFTPNASNFLISVLNNNYDDTNVLDNITYYYRITALDEVPNEGNPSDLGNNKSTDTTPPEKVTNLQISNPGTGNTLELSWTASSASDIIGYQIYRSQISGFSPSETYYLANVSSNYYTDSGLEDDDTYYYRIIAYDEVPNFGTASDESSGVPHDSTPPDPTTGLNIVNPGTGNRLNLTWEESNASDLVKYNIYRSTTFGFTPSKSTNLINTSTVNYYVDNNVTDGITYYYRISAEDEVPNEGNYSDQESGVSSNIIPPSKVVGEQIIIVSNSQLDIIWALNSESDMLNYSLYRSTTSGFTPNSSNWLANVSHPQNYYNDTGLILNQTYYYRISAIDNAGNEGEFSSEVAGTPGGFPPGKVENLKIFVVDTGNALNLEWADLNLTENDIDHYNVYRSTSSGFTPGSSYLIGTATGLYYNDTGLIDAQIYYYRVAGVDIESLVGDPSDQQNGTPSDTIAPSQVQNLNISVIATGNALNITWNESIDTDTNYYYIYNSTSEFDSYTFLANISDPITYYLHSGLIDGQDYWYKVSAVDEALNKGQNSTSASGTPADSVAPPKVTGLTISVIETGNELYLEWDVNNASDLDGYKIFWGINSGEENLTNTITTTNNYYSHTGLSDDQAYYYRVAAYDEVPNFGNNSTEKSGIPHDSTPPPQITGLIITDQQVGNYLKLDWDELTGILDLNEYIIYRSTISGFTPGPGNEYDRTTNNYYNDLNVIDGTTYYYRVSAIDEVPNEGTPSSEGSGTSSDQQPPNQVENLQITSDPRGNRLNLSWNRPSGDVYGYAIYRNNSLIRTVEPDSQTYYSDSGLVDGRTYYYKISAYDEVPNYGDNSTAVSGVPQDTTPPSQVIGVS
ncbi:MAG: hypothetical protein GF329_22810, partial [Candidatus Lokiarchaeota archaeon]|nr:hypothetical protein [Candidatus Lokiarchaeota archaeon]